MVISAYANKRKGREETPGNESSGQTNHNVAQV